MGRSTNHHPGRGGAPGRHATAFRVGRLGRFAYVMGTAPLGDVVRGIHFWVANIVMATNVEIGELLGGSGFWFSRSTR